MVICDNVTYIGIDPKIGLFRTFIDGLETPYIVALHKNKYGELFMQHHCDGLLDVIAEKDNEPGFTRIYIAHDIENCQDIQDVNFWIIVTNALEIWLQS